MRATLDAESTLTDRYQTTVPETVRRALRLGKRDKIQYTIRPGGEVVMARAVVAEDNDPVLAQFLSFLSRDIARHPEDLQAIDTGTRLAFDVIVQDPTRQEYRQGNTLGDGHKHWFRAKFFQRFRLFFRYHAPSRVIVFAWVNDEDTKRAYESSDDAYRVFRKMLKDGRPPDDWHQLLAEASAEGKRLQRFAAGDVDSNSK